MVTVIPFGPVVPSSVILLPPANHKPFETGPSCPITCGGVKPASNPPPPAPPTIESVMPVAFVVRDNVILLPPANISWLVTDAPTPPRSVPPIGPTNRGTSIETVIPLAFVSSRNDANDPP